MTLELKFVIQSRGLTWKFEALNIRLTLTSEPKVWLEGLKVQVLSRSLVGSLSLKFEVKVWIWSLELKFKVEVLSECLKLMFKIDFENDFYSWSNVSGWSLKLRCEVKVWIWRLRFEVWSSCLTLKLEVAD